MSESASVTRNAPAIRTRVAAAAGCVGRWAAPVVALWLGTGCARLPQVVPPCRDGGEQTEVFHLVRYGWHTGVVVEAADLNRRLPELRRRFPQARQYEIGWGDAGFYQATEVDSGMALRAMLLSPGTVVHVVGFGDELAGHFRRVEVRELTATGENYRRLLEFLASSFARGGDGRVIAAAPGLFGDSQFYQGVGRYHLCNTCNNWTAKALHSGGVADLPRLRFTAGSVMRAVAE